MNKSTVRSVISLEVFHELTRPLVGQIVSQAHRGCGSCIMLEIGELSPETVRFKSGRETTFLHGQFSVMIEWSWRVERPASIYFGSWSTERIINNRLPKLEGRSIIAIEVEGRLPELVLQLSDGLWVHSFTTVESQPEWCVFLDRKQQPHEWLISDRGKIVKETSLRK